MSNLSLHIVVPFHQPLSASPADMEAACEQCYLPLLDAIESRPTLRVALHFNGHLLDHLSRRRPELLLRLKGLIAGGRIEILGGLFYGGVPALLPEMDIRGQIQMMAEFWESFIGQAPRGFWLPDLAWSLELPRMLDETGLAYGFVSSSQLAGVGVKPPSLGMIERGGQSVGALVLSAGLSCVLPTAAPDEWLHALLDSGRNLEAVWVRAESLGWEPRTAGWALGINGWVAQWFDAIVEAEPTVTTVLPGETFANNPLATPLKLHPGLATELAPLAAQHGPADWTDFVARHSELDTLYRRMLRASDKLRTTIGAMEEEGLEDEWSDALATAQRLVFAAQSSDVYWRGAHPGFTDPRVRDGALERLCEAETMIDTLIQGNEDWIGVEEEDRDGDLVDEVFAANRFLAAWLVPARAGAVRTLDDREECRSLLDAGVRRSEPFVSEMAQAELASETRETDAPPKRGADLRRLEADLPVTADNIERIGIREWLLDADATPDELFSGTVDRSRQELPDTEVLENRINEDGDCSYTLRVRSMLRLEGVRPRVATVYKAIALPIDAAELQIACDVELEGEGNGLLALEIPLRLRTATSVEINGKSAGSARAVHPEVEHLRVTGDGVVTIRLEPALDVWLQPVRTTVRDLDGYRAADQGLVVVPVLPVADNASMRIVLQVGERSLVENEESSELDD